MKKLVVLFAEYRKYQQWGYSNRESAERAVNEAFADTMNKPYLHKDKYEDPSHVFYGEDVLFFDGSIYTQTLT